jgi:holo-[acyl-carrier protein] synthase
MCLWWRAHPERQESTLVTGLDLVDAREVRTSVEHFGERYLRRIYTEQEVASCGRGAPSFATRLAARFAAKEAVLKVLRAAEQGIDWRSIEVVRCDDGAPMLRLQGRAAEVAAQQGFFAFSVSLTHETDYAGAVVIGQRRMTTKPRSILPWR